MNLKHLLVVLVALSISSTNAQTETQEELNKFFFLHDSLLSQAAQNDDGKTFRSVLTKVQKKYKTLPIDFQKAFASYKSLNANWLYDLSSIYARNGNERKSLISLKKAINEGFTDYERIQRDTDLDGIRNHRKFDPITTKILNNPLAKLKKAAKYNLNDTREFPPFSYQSMDDENLVNLKIEYNLDSIAGNGDEISKILNLMHWVHNVVRHDGSSLNPEVQNASNIIRVCADENRGVNCRMMATVLNECYLAMGIKSRQVTCKPGEENFDECHVINAVYSADLEKWLWIDPTFEAYVMNENDEMLSIQEVRERLARSEPLVLNEGANWNNEIQQSKEYYLETYMAKNLYRIQCPSSSEFNAETSISGKSINYIELLPLDYVNQEPDNSKKNGGSDQLEIVYYVTNNPSLFWASPIE